MVFTWEGEAPSDAQEWVDVLFEALGEEASWYWLHFYQKPGGWRFELERHGDTPGPGGWTSYRRADESTALRVFTSLVERGKPLDPSWTPSAASALAEVVRMPRRAAQPAHTGAPREQQTTALETPPADNATVAPPVSLALPAPSPEPPTHSASTPPLIDFERPETLETPPPETGTRPEPVALDPAAPNREPLPHPVSPARATDRFPPWRILRPVLVYTPAILLVAFAWWLSRERHPSSPASAPAPSAPAVLRPVAQTRLQEPAQIAPTSKTAQASPGRHAKASTAVGATQRRSIEQPAQPSRRRVDEIRPPTPPPPRRGELVDLNDPAVTPPVPVSRTGRPPYPPLALARGLPGTVLLNALVDETGRVVEVALVRTSAPGLGFEDAAMRYVHSRVYRPATKRGVPVRVRLPIMIDFQVPGH